MLRPLFADTRKWQARIAEILTLSPINGNGESELMLEMARGFHMQLPSERGSSGELLIISDSKRLILSILEHARAHHPCQEEPLPPRSSP